MLKWKILYKLKMEFLKRGAKNLSSIYRKEKNGRYLL
jgi:hypothetical protein